MDEVKGLAADLAEVAEGVLDTYLETGGAESMENEIDALLAEFDDPIQKQVVQMEADGYAVELFRARLQVAGGGSNETVEELEAYIQVMAELYGVSPRPLAPETKAELKKQAIERFRVDFQRLQTRARVQMKNGNQAGLKATEETQERIREAVRAIAALE